ncbi:histidine kinase [Streptomyces sp. SID13726]|nr:histidine kinase [Streptomyces sp. SID13726]
MNRTDDRLLPALLLCAQAAVWPGAELVRGTVPSGYALLVAALVAGSVTAVLALRRARPVTALAVVAVACALGAGPLPAGATAVLGTAGVALALLTVATERDAFTAVLCVAALACWQSLQGITLHGLTDHDGLDLVLTALLYAASCGAGLLLRRRRHAARAAEALLKRAESERHRLPAVERRRMERELHDVSAHHLTAVVVTAGAALGLRERRPELTEEALEFTAETGREVTRALGAVRAPAPSREELPSPEERLLALVAGFRRLDQSVDCAIDPLPEGAVADAAYGIVREALTNVARYAPGAPTTVVCRYGDSRTDVVVTSAAPREGAATHGAGLGGGRGQGFLRSRARELGGTLTTGPTPEGGWEVRAVLPGRSTAPVDAAVPRGYRVAQVVAALGLVLQPLLPALVIRAEDTSSASRVSAGLLFALLAAAQAVALLWLRRAPRVSYGMLLGVALLWPVAMAVGDYGGPVLLPPVLGVFGTGVAVVLGAAARTGSSGEVSGRGSLLAVAAHTVSLVAAVLDRGSTAPVWAVVGGSLAGSAAVIGGARLAGTRWGRRDRAVEGERDARVAGWTEEAVRDAWAERRRIADGLETTVLSRTAAMVAEAEAGRLEPAADRAREALAAMRALLDAVRDGETGPELRPQPTLQALDLLAHQCRATGREVEIRLTERVPERLPTAVDLAAYHAAETLLGAGGADPAVLELDAHDGTLTLTATGVPGTAAVRERLAARIAPLGGSLAGDEAGAGAGDGAGAGAGAEDKDRAGAAGTVRVRLPIVPVPRAGHGEGER